MAFRSLTREAVLLALLSPAIAHPQQSVEPQLGIQTDAGTFPFPPGSHPLEWWTHDPLRLRARNELLIGLPAADGHTITTRDFQLHQTVTTLGTIAGHRIIQIMLKIHPGPNGLGRGITVDPDDPSAGDTLLIQSGAGDSYMQIYGIQVGNGTFQPFKPAAIVGSGNDRILTTYDPNTGNGGGCSDGYWWFDRTGAHPVDFSPLDRAIQPKLPPNTGYTGRCWAIHPERNTVQSSVQRTNAECHACGFVGDLAATYRITHGVAEPVSITFTPQPE